MVLVVKNPTANAGDIGDLGPIPALGRSPGEENGNPLQYSCLENPVDRGAWWATVHRVTKSRTRLKRFSTTQHIYIYTYIFNLDSVLDTKDSVENKIDMVPVSMACIEYKEV